MHSLAPQLARLAASSDTALHDVADAALRQLSGDQEAVPETHEPPAEMGMGVG
jgi:hypothetical protein